MDITFRWYGKDDPVTLEKIRQVPVIDGIVSAIYEVPPGELWEENKILAMKNEIESAGLTFEVVESLPVSEDIKLGTDKAPELLDIYCENVRRLAKYGVKCICYNFMPVFDWFRSELYKRNEDNSTCLAYIEEDIAKIDPYNDNLSLPGWDESYSQDEVRNLIDAYREIGEEGLWKNLEIFLKKVIPVAEECGINFAIHPDDPPWSLFGLDRIITGVDSYKRFFELVDSKANGITLCTGSLGASKDNDLSEIIKLSEGRIHFVHLRNVKLGEGRDFEETAHPSKCGSLDMVQILRDLKEVGFDGYLRPDHGRMIWGETGKPGYGLYDRALGAMYIAGIWETLD